MELREEIAAIIAPKLREPDYGSALFLARELADRILSLPRIKEALDCVAIGAQRNAATAAAMNDFCEDWLPAISTGTRTDG